MVETMFGTDMVPDHYYYWFRKPRVVCVDKSGEIERFISCVFVLNQANCHRCGLLDEMIYDNIPRCTEYHWNKALLEVI